MSHDHQIMWLLFAASLIVLAVVIARAIRDARRVIDNAPTYEASRFARRPAPEFEREVTDDSLVVGILADTIYNFPKKEEDDNGEA